MAVVALDYGVWLARYPEFATLSPVLVLGYWSEAGLYCDNSDSSPITDAGLRAMLLGMATAHIAAISGGVNGETPSPLVGRITNAGEGSVSVGVDMGSTGSAMQAFWQQTKYGTSFWNATARYRRGRYLPGPRYTLPSLAPGGYGFDRTP